MAEIIPSINCPRGDFECVKDKVRRVEMFAKWLHLDVADGRFTFHKSWDDASRWRELGSACQLEVHLMVEEPEHEVASWIASGARRLILHAETLWDERYRALPANPDEMVQDILRECEDAECELMLSTNPETPIEGIASYLNLFSSFHVLTVHPGPSGQSFLPLTLKKVEYLRSIQPSAHIEVDGGITPRLARLAIAAGADMLVSGAYLFESPDPEKAYKELARI